MNIKLSRSELVNTAAFFSTMPFVAPIPINSDVQYPIFLVCGLIFLLDVIKGRIHFNRLDMYFLLVAMLSFVYINPFSQFTYSIEKRVGLLFAFFLFYVFSRYWHLVSPKVIFAGIYINFFGAITHLLLPGPFSTYAGLITRDIKIDSFETRGVSSFAPEPGFFGAVSIYFILICFLMWTEGRISRNKFVLVTILSLAMALMSKSGTSTLMLAILLISSILFAGIKIWKKVLIGAVGMLLVVVIAFNSGWNGRGSAIARGLIENPRAVFLTDRSVAFRGVAISVGVASITKGHFFGHGVGTLKFVAKDIIADTYFFVLYDSVVDRAGSLLSSLAQYTVELGMFFIFLILWLYTNTRLLPYIVIVRIVSLLYLIASFSILFPPLWLLIACTDKRALVRSTSIAAPDIK